MLSFGSFQSYVKHCAQTFIPASFDPAVVYLKCEALSNSNLLNEITGLYDYPIAGTPSINTSIKRSGTGSLYLSSSSQYVNIANKIDCRSSVYSLSMWFYNSASGNSYVNLFCLSTAGSGHINATMIRFVNGNPSTQLNEYTMSTNYVINRPQGNTTNMRTGWHHLVWAGFGNSTTRSLYVDGVLWSTYTAVAYALNATGTVSRIGSSAWTTGEAFNGYLDEIQVFPYVLSQAQVTTLYRTGLLG
jgi:hypothetical protein